jgi:hypothetical protein
VTTIYTFKIHLQQRSPLKNKKYKVTTVILFSVDHDSLLSSSDTSLYKDLRCPYFGTILIRLRNLNKILLFFDKHNIKI